MFFWIPTARSAPRTKQSHADPDSGMRKIDFGCIMTRKNCPTNPNRGITILDVA
jgi:hypothetical protein